MRLVSNSVAPPRRRLEEVRLALEVEVVGRVVVLEGVRPALFCCRKLSMMETSSWASASLASMI